MRTIINMNGSTVRGLLCGHNRSMPPVTVSYFNDPIFTCSRKTHTTKQTNILYNERVFGTKNTLTKMHVHIIFDILTRPTTHRYN